MFCRCNRIAKGRVHHDNAAVCCGFNVDIVDTDTGAANDFEVFRLRDNLSIRARRGTNGEPVILRNDFNELFF